jgi:endonuclease/exonuclease/phosphatase family metal-dependent hydrolase
VQFCAGRGQRFFFDGGRAVRVQRAEVESALAGVIEVLRSLNPDLVVLQEVDRDSDRTARVDEHARIGAALGLSAAVSTPYHRARFVPFPAWESLGRIDLHLSVFSRWRIDRAYRHALPLLAESWLRQQFNLRRAILEVGLTLDDGRPFTLFDTHLSAFSFGDGTVARQVAVVEERLKRAETDGGRWVLAGDLNALPPGDDSARLGDDAAQYPEDDSPLRPLFARFASVLSPDRWLDPANRTWVPWGSNRPDRVLDYVFHGSSVESREFRTEPAGARWSDHLPLVVDLVVR